MSRRGLIGLLAGLVMVPTVTAQTELAGLVESARAAWMRHDARALFAASDTVRLRLPQVSGTQGLQPAQAARLLAGFWADAEEAAVDVREVREVADDEAYAELARRFVVRGTTETRVQAIYLGFRRDRAGWRLREVRIIP